MLVLLALVVVLEALVIVVLSWSLREANREVEVEPQLWIEHRGTPPWKGPHAIPRKPPR